MSLTNKADLANQVQTRWSPVFSKELRSSKPMLELVNKDYEGAIQNQGDTVRVSQVTKATGQLLTVGGSGADDANIVSSEKLTTQYVDVVANKLATASFEIASLAQLQSQLDSAEGQSEIRSALLEGVANQINDYLWSLSNPSTSSPDHLINSKASLAATDLSAYRTLAAKAKWLKNKGWFGLLNPDYYGDLLEATTMTSKDYVGDEAPVIGGEIVNKRFGFGLIEDNSRNSAKGLFFHPDYLVYCVQQGATWKLSDLHVVGKRGYLLTVDVLFGAKLGIDGNKKHIYVTSAASGIDYSA
jgi:hypothetical protein